MSRKEVPRAGLVKAALAGKITNAEGARALRLSVRQFRRLKKRFREHQPSPAPEFVLREVHALAVSRSSVRTLRLAAGRPAKRPRAAPKHRRRRPRKAALGQLAQLDASPFAWFEDRGPAATLHGLIAQAARRPRRDASPAPRPRPHTHAHARGHRLAPHGPGPTRRYAARSPGGPLSPYPPHEPKSDGGQHAPTPSSVAHTPLALAT
jgi:hypothetical protein